MRIAVTTKLVLLLVLFGQGDAVAAQRQSVVKDGDYVGLEKMPNLTPDDRAARWFHENTLVTRNDEAILDKVPITIRHGKKSYSASDGGFMTYRARFTRKGGQTVISVRLFESDYLAFPVGKHDQYTEIKEYPVTFVSDAIEFGDVRYELTKLRKIELDRLLPLLSTEPLEKHESGPDSVSILKKVLLCPVQAGEFDTFVVNEELTIPAALAKSGKNAAEPDMTRARAAYGARKQPTRVQWLHQN